MAFKTNIEELIRLITQDKYRRIEQIDQKCINSYWYWITLRSHFAQLLPSTPPHYQLIRIVLRRRMSSAIRQSLTSKWLFTPFHLRAILYSSPTGFKGKIEMQKIINSCFYRSGNLPAIVVMLRVICLWE